MTTITTVELRNNLADYVERLAKGESFQLTYRRRKIGRLEPPKQPEFKKGDPQAIAASLRLLKLDIPDDIKNDPRTIKEIYREMRMNNLYRR
jgi:antitoxin (DNA-binding transcriptional repressor) of toxin-antitoxin stability system